MWDVKKIVLSIDEEYLKSIKKYAFNSNYIEHESKGYKNKIILRIS